MNFCPPPLSQTTDAISNQEECFIDNLSSGYNLDHYGLIAATIKELNIIEEIDKRLPVSQLKGAKVTMGQCVAVMLLNGLGFINNRLYMCPNFLENKSIEHLLDIEGILPKGITKDDFNEYVLGRTLDAISEYGSTKLFTEISLKIVGKHKLLKKFIHLDTTSVSVYGEYENNYEKDGLKITNGYAKNHRIDLNQIVLSMAVTGAAAIPIWAGAHNGNSSDKKVLPDVANRLNKIIDGLKQVENFIIVGDSAMYENILQTPEIRFISRIPHSIGQIKKILREPSKSFSWQQIDDNYKIAETQAVYKGIKQRCIIVTSQAAYQRSKKNLKKKIKTESKEISKKLWHLENKIFNSEEDAKLAAERTIKNFKYHEVDFQIVVKSRYSGRGRPNKEKIAQKKYQISSIRTHLNKDAIMMQLRQSSRFVLATNVLCPKEVTSAELLKEYKNQSKVENGFRFLKNAAFQVTSVFLKKPSRIESLSMLMVLCLLVYNFAQNHLRQCLHENKETVTNQKKKAIQNPTMVWIFQKFQGIIKIKDVAAGGIRSRVLNLKSEHVQIINYFGPIAQKYYGLKHAG